MSNKNTRKENRQASSAQRRYSNTYGKKRILASALAIVLALAMIAAYVIEVGMFANM